MLPGVVKMCLDGVCICIGGMLLQLFGLDQYMLITYSLSYVAKNV